MKKEIIFFDMDGVLADFDSGVRKLTPQELEDYKSDSNGKPHYDDVPGIFSRMDMVKGAHDAVKQLNQRYDLYILSCAPWNNPTALNDKKAWINKHFSDITRIDDNGNPAPVFHKRLTLTHQKGFCNMPGAFLIDDRSGHGAKDFGSRWIQFGSTAFPDWPSVVDYFMSRLDDSEDLDLYCERQGFEFHSNGRSRWGVHPYWSFGAVEYVPADKTVLIRMLGCEFKGRMESVSQFLTLLKAVGIDKATLYDKSRAHDNAVRKNNQRLELAKRVASRIKIRFGFRDEKCLQMAMSTEWFRQHNHYSDMSLRNVDAIASQVLEDIEKGKIQ